MHPRLPIIPQHLAHGGGVLNTAFRSTALLALACCLFPAIANAQQLRQPASVLPLKSPKPLPSPEIAAPQVDEVPTWLLEASQPTARKSTKANRVTRKSARPKPLPMVETENFSMLGDIRLSYPRQGGVQPTKRNRPSISLPDPSIEAHELPRFFGTRQARNLR